MVLTKITQQKQLDLNIKHYQRHVNRNKIKTN